MPLPSAFHGNIVGLAWTILLAGFVTASLVQWVKDLLGWRSRFHRRIVRQWLARRAKTREVYEIIESIGGKTLEYRFAEDAISQLEILLGAQKHGEVFLYGARRPWYTLNPSELIQKLKSLPVYSLPAEQLCGQLASAAETVIAAPKANRELFAVLTVSGKSFKQEDFKKDLKTYVDGRSAKAGDLSDQAYADLRAQFMIRAQRSLDNLQILIGQRWRRALTAVCLFYSFVFAFLVVGNLLGAEAFEKWSSAVPPTLIVTVAGALMAPVVHDLTLAIRSFRRP